MNHFLPPSHENTKVHQIIRQAFNLWWILVTWGFGGIIFWMIFIIVNTTFN